MDALQRLRLRQDQIVTRQQLTQIGLSRGEIRWRLERGHWRQVLPNVIATVTGKLTRRQEIIAAGLFAGPEAQIAGVTALELHGFRYAPKDRTIHLIVPRKNRIASRPGVTIRRTDRLDKNSWSNGAGPRICSPARAAIDALQGNKDRQKVRAVLAEAVQRSHASVRQLAYELNLAQRNGSALMREVLTEVAGGARSAPEAALKQLAKTSRILPPVRGNPKMPDGLPTPDGYIEEARMALEVDSREFHLSPDDWEKTLQHHNRLAAAGILVLHFTPKQIEDAYSERTKRRTAA